MRSVLKVHNRCIPTDPTEQAVYRHTYAMSHLFVLVQLSGIQSCLTMAVVRRWPGCDGWEWRWSN